MDNVIDITGIDLAQLLVALYHGTRAVGLGVLHDRPDFDLADANEALAYARSHDGKRIYFDYLAGRPLKLGILGNELSGARLYDRDAGEGACQRAVDSCRVA